MKITAALALAALAGWVATCDSSPREAEPASSAPATNPSIPLQLQAERLAVEGGFDPEEVRVVADPQGQRYSLRIGDVPVWGVEAKASDGVVRMANVRFEPRFAVDTRPRITPQGAVVAALDALGDPSARLTGSDLVLLPREKQRLIAAIPQSRAPNAKDYERVITELTLIYRLHLLTGGMDGVPERRWLAQIDAGSGEVLEVAPTGVEVDRYRSVIGYGKYVGTRSLYTLFDEVEGAYRLQDTLRKYLSSPLRPVAE